MRQIIHIITDDPRMQNKFYGEKNVLILPLLATTEDGYPDYTKSKWHYEITIEDSGETIISHTNT